VLGEFARQDQLDGCHDLAGAQGLGLADPSKLAGLGGDFLEVIVAIGVHDGHSLRGNALVTVDLLQDLEDVARPGADGLLGPLARLGLPGRLLGLRGLLGLGGLLGRHIRVLREGDRRS